MYFGDVEKLENNWTEEIVLVTPTPGQWWFVFSHADTLQPRKKKKRNSCQFEDTSFQMHFVNFYIQISMIWQKEKPTLFM